MVTIAFLNAHNPAASHKVEYASINSDNAPKLFTNKHFGAE
jgi:hypothetical protein